MSQPHRIAIVTDSTSDLPSNIRERLDIRSVPLNVHFGAATFQDRIDISNEEFLRRLTSEPVLPTTSQPSTGIFEMLFRELADSYDAIVCVLMSSKLSGTMQSAHLAAAAVAEVIKVEVVDSLNSSLALGLMAVRARELSSSGEDAASIAQTLRAETNSYHLVFFAETLEYLHRGGRIGKAATLLGSMLQLKPLIRVEEGVVIPFERTRTRKKALLGLEAFVSAFASIDTLAVLHIDTPDDAATLLAKIAPKASRIDIPIGVFGPVVATHVGPGAVGIVVRELGTSS
ncbi:MAG: DegV family protein [Thermomicrobiales bacterium]